LLRRGEGKGGKGWDGMGRGGKGRERRGGMGKGLGGSTASWLLGGMDATAARLNMLQNIEAARSLFYSFQLFDAVKVSCF
jgi:hypothetical protein